MPPILVVVAVIIGVLGLWFGFRRPIERGWKSSRTIRAILNFGHRREYLEAEFERLAIAAGKPRGLRWVQCDWRSETRFAHDRESGLLTAFVGLNISFEAVEGSDMEDVEHVGLVRDATALFHCQDGVWGTGGRALFNMHPQQAVERLAGQFTPVDLPPGIYSGR